MPYQTQTRLLNSMMSCYRSLALLVNLRAELGLGLWRSCGSQARMMKVFPNYWPLFFADQRVSTMYGFG